MLNKRICWEHPKQYSNTHGIILWNDGQTSYIIYLELVKIQMTMWFAYLQDVGPYNGYGSLEDSLGSALSLVPQAPKKDFMKMLNNEGKHLRYEAIMVCIHIILYDPLIFLNSHYTIWNTIIPTASPNALFYCYYDLYINYQYVHYMPNCATPVVHVWHFRCITCVEIQVYMCSRYMYV